MDEKQVPILEVRCGQCDGPRRVPVDPRAVYCRECGGVGYIATEFGERVMAFIEHRARLLASVVGDELECTGSE